jgi:hypothetical protein
MKTISKPLTFKQLDAVRDEDGRVDLVVEVNLTDLIELTLEGLNDLITDKICGEDCFGGLMDLSYNVVGHRPEDAYIGGFVSIRVQALASEVEND